MDRKSIIDEIQILFEKLSENIIAETDAICPDAAGMKLFDSPLVGFGAATDDLFTQFKREDVIGPWFMTPQEWLKNGKTVLSLFFPFTEDVKKDSRRPIIFPNTLV